MNRESLRKGGNRGGNTRITKRKDNKVFMNPLEFGLTIIRSLRH